MSVKILGADEAHVFVLKRENHPSEPRVTWGQASNFVEKKLSNVGIPVALTARTWDVVDVTVSQAQLLS